MKPRPPIVSIPTREKGDGLGATEYCTVPLPVPEAPAVTVSQAELLDAVQAQPADVATVMDAVVPPPPRLIDVGVRLNVQAAPACVMVTGSPEIVSVPVLPWLEVLAATL